MTADDRAPSPPSDAPRPDPAARGAEGIDGPACRTVIAEIVEGGAARLADEQSLSVLPFCDALGMRLLAIGDGEALLATPYDPALIGDPETGVIHGGVITTLLDTAAGVAAGSVKGAGGTGLATLDLRIDYMRPAEPGRVIFAKARLFRRARQIAFIRARAFDCAIEDGMEEDGAEGAGAVAVAVGAFMQGSKVGLGEKGGGA